MLKKLTILLSCFAFIISSSSLASFADYFYGAFYNGTGYELKQVDGNGNSGADFIMRFTKMPDEEHLETYCISINNRFKEYGRFNYETNKWPFILHGTYINIPTIKGYDRHHPSSNAVIEKVFSKGAGKSAPTITLRKSLHRETPNYGSSKSAKAYRMKEYQYMKENGIKSAVRKELEELGSMLEGTSAMDVSFYSCLKSDSKANVPMWGEEEVRTTPESFDPKFKGLSIFN